MELKEYIAIFMKNIRTFWLCVVMSLAIAFVWQGLQPKSYDATLLLNIGRSGVKQTVDYTYDDFYRLQADERFADTVVRWLGSPRVVEDILSEAKLDTDMLGMRGLGKTFYAKRLSSQMIEVSYSSRNQLLAGELSNSVVSALNRYAESLNKEGGEPGWFVIIGSDPVIRDGRIGLPAALLIGLGLGVFIGFWAAFLRHYFRKD